MSVFPPVCVLHHVCSSVYSFGCRWCRLLCHRPISWLPCCATCLTFASRNLQANQPWLRPLPAFPEPLVAVWTKLSVRWCARSGLCRQLAGRALGMRMRSGCKHRLQHTSTS